ncbi:hypothetical protein A3K78_03125 [Candidatus Bathyarchaeota archaeon RBG_13_52_12]|nr:MAG: hypothetical protein A3K78_03125 [Candidatus Bathyarchaeota archaeon RBG_13_52_12]
MIILAKIETIINTELPIKSDEVWLKRRQLRKRQQRKKLLKKSKESGVPLLIPLPFLRMHMIRDWIERRHRHYIY